jgi:hypothetical protein
MNDIAIMNKISQYWNPKAKRCGRLLHKRDWVFHYGVGLSNEKMISWSGLENGSKGSLVIHDIAPDYWDAQWISLLPKAQVYRNILGSVSAFHNERWHYHFLGWNCEHWARLAATGQPICYQMTDFPGWFIDVFTGKQLHWRGEAIPHLAAHIAAYSH